MKLLTKIEIISVISFLALIVYGIYVVNEIESDGLACINNPLPYGVQELSNRLDYHVACACYVGKPGSLPIIVESSP